MNVAYDPWIPVVDLDGNRRLASLHALLVSGEQFVDLAVRPHERVALMRLLLCVSHASLNGPQNYDKWLAVSRTLPLAVDAYLAKWRDSFELFHPVKPWLQVAGIVKNKGLPVTDADWTPVVKLVFSFASGNNSTLFDHQGEKGDRALDLPDAVLAMLTYQCFSPGGLISQVFWNDKQSGKSSKDAPCVPASMIHAFLRGENLLEIVHLNLTTFEDIKNTSGDCSFGKPIWEAMPRNWSDLENVKNAVESYIGRLVPMTRLIKLHHSGQKMLLGDGLVYPTFTDGFPAEPTATVMIRKRSDKEERTLLSYRPTKALWRELAAVVVKRTAGKLGGPLSLLNVPDDRGCDLIVSALARDKATILDTTESVFHIPAQMRTDDGAMLYESEVQWAESVAGRLGWSVETYRMEVDQGWEGRLKSAGPKKGQLKARLHAKATTHYWTAVENSLDLLMAHIETLGTNAATSSLKLWRKTIFTAACEAYRVACGQETPRQMRAFVKGWQRLNIRKDKPKDTNQLTKEEVA